MKNVELGVVKLVKKGQHYALDLQDNQKQLCQNLFEYCFNKKGGYLRVDFKVPRKKRSTGKNSQNSHLNGHIQQLAEDTGNSFDIVKAVVKDRAIDMGYPMLDGILQYDMMGLKKGQSETDCDTIECNILIESVHILSAEYGCILKEY